MFEQILVPVDDSPESKAVLSYLPALIYPARSEVILAEAGPFLKSFMNSDSPESVRLPFPGIDPIAAQEDLFSTVETLRTFGIRARAAARPDSCAEISRSFGPGEPRSLLALSRRHELGLWHFLTGAVTERILDTPAVPIFAVNLGSFGKIDHWTRGFVQGPRFRRILVPMAGSATAMDAVQAAIRFARHSHGSLVLEELETREDLVQNMRADTRKALALCAQESVSAFRRSQVGEPSTAILHVSDECTADLIVMSSACMRQAAPGALGATAARVLQEAFIPVLVVPGTKARDPLLENASSRS
jgi:nucleotide-binding universal stress UspA family protein